MRVAPTVVTLIACPVLGCGKFQDPADAQAPGPDEIMRTENDPQEADSVPRGASDTTPDDMPVSPVGEAASCSASPPPLVLQSTGGEQAGIIGSFCIDNAQLGCGSCVDRRLPHIESFTVAHPGDELRIAMPDARLVANPRCNPACSLEAVITVATCFEGDLLSAYSLGDSEGVAQRTVFAQDQAWTLAVSPGLYFLTVSGGEFSASDGWRGDASGTFGLLVDRDRERTSVGAARFYAECLARSIPDAGGDLVGIDADAGVASEGR
jgi:hypothetical protein